MTHQKVARYAHCVNSIFASNGTHNLMYLRRIFAAITLCAATVPSYGAAPQDPQIQEMKVSNRTKLPSQKEISIHSNALANNAKPVAKVDVLELKRFLSAFNVLANDSDADGDRLILTDAMAEFGAVAFTPDGLIGYAQNPGKPRADKITYIASDGRGGFATGTVEIVGR